MNLKESRNHITHICSISTTNRQFQRFIQDFIEPFKNCFDELLNELIPSDTGCQTQTVRHKLSKAGIPNDAVFFAFICCDAFRGFNRLAIKTIY